MLDPNTVSQLVGVFLMLAPSTSDNHLENYSQPLLMFTTHAACEQNAESVNQQQIPVVAPDTGELTIVHAWCKGVYE
ncbi:hypothetical protein PP753_gp12 [Dinoroseobacter phage vB_DshP-R7L]|uniref:Uncharacterized protein n=1 Tax=Dinoroseobacter phage vB_DshP-R7L TaxID=2873349 RepID=A0AAE8XBE7_9CAUD|nr:hypothetical protein PP753_gp12 [Dinoroseobacter phage vB_DshP-R7L]UAT28851.1 hypothetical protein R7L_gp12 [Dinoroseobacter phage vB_DshP-R7L]